MAISHLCLSLELQSPVSFSVDSRSPYSAKTYVWQNEMFNPRWILNDHHWQLMDGQRLHAYWKAFTTTVVE